MPTEAPTWEETQDVPSWEDTSDASTVAVKDIPPEDAPPVALAAPPASPTPAEQPFAPIPPEIAAEAAAMFAPPSDGLEQRYPTGPTVFKEPLTNEGRGRYSGFGGAERAISDIPLPSAQDIRAGQAQLGTPFGGPVGGFTEEQKRSQAGFASGVAEQVKGLGAFTVSPLGQLTAVAGGPIASAAGRIGGALIHKLITAGFLGQMATHFPEQVEARKKAYATGTPEEQGVADANLAGSILMMGGLGKHLASPIPKAAPSAIPEPAPTIKEGAATSAVSEVAPQAGGVTPIDTLIENTRNAGLTRTAEELAKDSQATITGSNEGKASEMPAEAGATPAPETKPPEERKPDALQVTSTESVPVRETPADSEALAQGVGATEGAAAVSPPEAVETPVAAKGEVPVKVEERTPDQIYDESLATFREASKTFTQAQKDYRAKKIGDAEFLAAKQAFNDAMAVSDKAETAFIDAKNAVESTPTPPPAPKPPEAAAKEPWQKTREQYHRNQYDEALAKLKRISEGKETNWSPMKRPFTKTEIKKGLKLSFDEWQKRHQRMDETLRSKGTEPYDSHLEEVQRAIAEGKPVPAEVLADYPDLAKPTAAPAKATGGVPPAKPAPKEAAPGVGEAAVTAASKVEDFIPSEQAMGITPVGRVTIDDTLTTPATLKSADPKVEARWQNARRSETSLWQKAKAAAAAIKNEFFRADPALDPKTDGVFIDAARRFRTVSRHSQEMAANVLRGFTAGFGKNKLEVYQRNIILRDLSKDVAAGKYEGREIPFGYTPETLAADVAKFSELAQLNPTVSDAIIRRDAFMDTLKRELVDSGALPESVLADKDYFHRQVIQYLDMRDAFTSGTSTSDVRTHQKGWQKKRTFSSKDYNTSYLESEYEVIAQSLAMLRTQKSIAEFKRHGDIKPKLQAQAKEINAANPDGKQLTWEDLIPEDHTIWQPKEGHAFYKAMTIPDKIIDAVLGNERVLSKSDLREVMAIGSPREQWVIPKRLASTLENINPPVESGMLSKLAHKITNAWKVWTLLNPSGSVKYGLNNLSGDLDIAFAYSPKIVSRYGAKSAGDMRRYVLKRGAINKEISDGIENGVLSGGFTVAEVPDINAHQFFRAMTGENVSLIERAWQKNKDYHNWRENTLRLASWRFFKDKLASAKKGERFYAASRKSEVDALYDAGAPKDVIAAKLARELIGDYGNISHAGQWIRSHAIPFYSWMEINSPRYVRLLKNAAAEGEGRIAGRVAKVGAKKAAVKIGTTAALSAGMYAAINLWNHTMFPKEEEELGENRRQLHLILGRNEDGTIRTFRVQGALSDALSWFGGEDLPSDVADVATGKETLVDKAKDALKAPPTKLISGVTPFIKTPAEALTRRSLFPDPFNPRPIRDPIGSLAYMFSLGKVYDYLSDKPMRPMANEIAGLVSYSTDPGEAAYHMTRGMVAAWRSKQGDESPSIIPTSRQNALFYHNKALSYGDAQKAERWKKRYFDLGGKEEGIDQSIRMSSPLGSMSLVKRTAFEKTLSPKEKEILDRAEKWHLKIYGAAGSPSNTTKSTLLQRLNR